MEVKVICVEINNMLVLHRNSALLYSSNLREGKSIEILYTHFIISLVRNAVYLEKIH